jgi:hypothetical protein
MNPTMSKIHILAADKTYSIPFADEKSVPVFFNDCIAARIP